MNLMPLAHIIQYQAQLGIDRGVPVVYNSRATARAEEAEMEAILNG